MVGALDFIQCPQCRSEVAIHRRFSDDMDDLRRAGLIDYADLRLNVRVSLTVPQKDPQMFLTLGEHEALRVPVSGFAGSP